MDFAPTKTAWMTRRLPAGLDVTWSPVGSPTVGDVLACEVITLSLLRHLDTADGRRTMLYPGDRIMCVVGNRYSTSALQGRGRVTGDVTEMLSASGLCGEVVGRSAEVAPPTTLRVLAQAHHADRPLNVRSFLLPPAQPIGPKPTWIVVAGSAMDAGKTTACASIIHGLTCAGYRVGAAKLTGTASPRDLSSFRDAGADPVLEFLDMGWPSTDGCDRADLAAIVAGLTGHLQAAAVQVGVLEIADGLLQRETEMILRALSGWLGPAHIVLATRESLAAVAGARQLRQMGHDVLAVTGVVTNSPLACQEVELAGAGPCIPTAGLGTAVASLVEQRGDRHIGQPAPVAVG
ncbi:hypothetical protein GCM10010112_87600 [Actinoplanes lobatus]|uniref:DUF1611 domain-containing protein n=1 Tax=Actinoplanes lobatus TaxID=113568 RepID=A0A7W7HR81_9ACTN|nr:hypothetical protein [Actinoplanes lobatus]MBB4755157.1 hypothetical protein [Actinoplanes lobatus]GGN96385.1 hypothetical protein GCM10010112_87600 [Actinoplanes lobatus]GIE45402.1 hypothetical protein Alo02nite_83000 [Actinoplanes lobatus]